MPVRENLDRGRKYRPHCVRFVLAKEVNILPYILSSVNKMFIIWQKQEQFNSFNVTGSY